MSGGNGKQEPVVGYLQQVELTNIRSHASLVWEAKPGPGWNVVLGDNGSGKSTFLRAIAYALLLAEEQPILRITKKYWLRSGAKAGHIKLGFQAEAAGVSRFSEVSFGLNNHQFGVASQDIDTTRIFSAGFGPFRRVTGRDSEYDQQFEQLPRLARIISLFDERYTLAETVAWLKLLHFKRLEGNTPSDKLLQDIQSFVNLEGFLPNGVRLDRTTSETIWFTDANDSQIPIEELSDGYRSILSLALSLVRQLVAHYGPDRVFDPSTKAVTVSGIVLVDEIDVHLHPSWQRQIGFFLRKLFPNIQWIVATHSPLICQAAIAETDTIYHLPRPGSDEEPHRVTGSELGRLVYGDMTDAFATEAMGDVGRSDQAYAELEKLGRLNRKEIDAGLTDEELEEQRRLRWIFGAGPLPERRA